MTSLRRQLLLFIVGGVLIVLLGAAVAVFAVARTGLREQLDESLAARARTFASLVIDELPDPEDGDEGGLAFDYKGSMVERELGVLVRISTRDGEILATSPGWPAHVETPVDWRELPMSIPHFAHVQPDGGQSLRMVTLVQYAAAEPPEEDEGADLAVSSESEEADREAEDGDEDEDADAEEDEDQDEEDDETGVDDDDELIPSDHVVMIAVAGRMEPIERAEAAVLAALLVGAGFAVFGTIAAVWFGIRRGLSPIGRLCDQLGQVDARELMPPADASEFPEELKPIINALDGLLDRIRGAMEREQRFTDAAAHELRTPIAELRTIADVAARYPDEGRLRRSVEEVRAISEEMAALLETLLAAARGGSMLTDEALDDVELVPLARETIARNLEQLESRGVACDFEGDETSVWRAPKGAVIAIVRNLVENAAEYTSDGGRIRIAATGNGAGASFEVENGPVELSESDAGRMFEPFWRADSARSDRRHCGLGLAIVASLGEALGMKCRAAMTAERALRVTISAQDDCTGSSAATI